ncbi:MAG: 50S ribosomal protein L11 methyltransferase [Verrucomicrobiota bacterium]
MDSPNMDNIYRWSKFVEESELDEWETRLIVDEVEYLVEFVVNRKRHRLDSYSTEREQAEELKKRYGGGVTHIKPEQWQPATGPESDKVLKILDQFVVTESDDAAHIQKLAAEHAGKTVLSFPPQLAFGTGGHPTTANCLRFLVDFAKANDSDDWDLLDLGCGSGILAVAGAKLNAKKIEALELDEIALDWARKNGGRHDVADAIDFIEADAIKWLREEPPHRYDVVAANLFRDLLVEVLPSLPKWLKPGGTVILSGFLTTQAKDVNDVAAKYGIELEDFLRRGKWVAAKGTFRV